MTTDLLQKEEEYRKLNEQLEKKSKYLLKEVDTVRKLQEDVFLSKVQKSIASRLHEETNSYNRVVESNSNDNLIIPASVNDMGFKGMSHFFRAKIKKLQDDMERVQIDIKNKNEECKKLHKDNQKLGEEKDKWFQISTSSKCHISKLESQNSALNAKVQSKENENIQLRKEIEELQKQLKSSNVTLSNNEMKFIRVNEECEKLKGMIKSMKQEEKEFKDMHKKQIDEMSLIIKRIEKHRNELINGFKKQLHLIDNLKKQKALIENLKLTEKLETDFLKILDWNIDD